ncbi:MAG: 50S ribosomal protein L18 [Deltaproteobacteria bacterium]|nr:50S ribosomal protein L18 [Deltaproteobacteria bacterium]MBV8452518.1 50S ribosomal protein L18 [Deltaproteobacteria bacterium]
MSFERAEKRHRRQARVRRKVLGSAQRPRLSVFRSLHHIYAQVVSDETGRTLVAASTVLPMLRGEVKGKNGVTAAKLVGKTLAERCREAGITEVVFDRNGFLYHGRVKALADAAREAGLKF